MRNRIPLFEFEDLPWFPSVIRQGMTDYLRFVFETLNLYRPVLPLLYNALQKTGTCHIVDLCSGSGGPLWKLVSDMRKSMGGNIVVTFTDKYPATGLYRETTHHEPGVFTYFPSSVDATDVPAQLSGLRTIFSGIHHFEDEVALKVLKNATDAGAGIAIFDGGGSRLLMSLGILLFHIPAMLLCSPFIRPFRLNRLIFTYLIPIIPVCTVWDGLVSVSRLRTADELMRLAHRTELENYSWTAGEVKSAPGLGITYLIGIPDNE